jgi:hypothetical protein
MYDGIECMHVHPAGALISAVAAPKEYGVAIIGVDGGHKLTKQHVVTS